MADELTMVGAFGTHDWQRAVDERTMDQLKSPGNAKKISESAHAFESLLIGKWLEAAEESLATVPGGDPDDQQSQSLHQFSVLGMQSLAEGISSAGGLGIATMLQKSLESR